MNAKKIVITGGPGTGKTSIINKLKEKGFTCIEEISRQITLEARLDGKEQLFLSDPLLFSEKLLSARIKQFKEAEGYTSDFIFMDRGIPDIVAYLDYAHTPIPQEFIESCKRYTYDKVFILSPWQEIFESDNERYENFDQAKSIHRHLLNTYKTYNYKLHDIPFGTIEARSEFILNSLQ